MAENDLQLRVALAMRRRREGLGVSQEAFADRVGLHRTYYSSIERVRVAELTPRLWKQHFADNPLRSDLHGIPQ